MSDVSAMGDGGQADSQQPGNGQQTTQDQQQTDTQSDGGQQQPGNQSAEPFAVFETADALNSRLSRAGRKALNDAAKEMGFDDWSQMQNVFKPKTGGDGGQQQQPVTNQAQTGEAERLKMALSIGQELNLPAALIGRLQGDTPEAMKADAEALMTLLGGQTQAAPTQRIPNAPNTERAVTFTKAQMQNPKFIRDNLDAITRAVREKRIVDS